MDTLKQPKWNVAKVQARLEPILARAGILDAEARASVIARTETAAIISEHRVRVYRAQEQERGKPFLYRDVGVDDHRRTKLSHWIQATIGDGKPLEACLRIMDEGISLAKAGAFAKDGALRGTPGQPITLPLNFRRRGFVAHFNERDTIVRVLR